MYILSLWSITSIELKSVHMVIAPLKKHQQTYKHNKESILSFLIVYYNTEN